MSNPYPITTDALIEYFRGHADVPVGRACVAGDCPVANYLSTLTDDADCKIAVGFMDYYVNGVEYPTPDVIEYFIGLIDEHELGEWITGSQALEYLSQAVREAGGVTHA